MFESINEVSVIVSAVLAMSVGSVWYSPLLFGDHWMRASGLTENTFTSSKDKMPQLLAYGMAVNLILLYVLAQFVSFAKEAGDSLVVTAVLLLLFLSAVMATAVIWEQKPFTYLLINMGYAAVVVFGGMGIIWFWPW